MAESDMYDALKQDYAAMSGMIFGTPPSFEDVMESISILQAKVNRLPEQSPAVP